MSSSTACKDSATSRDDTDERAVATLVADLREFETRLCAAYAAGGALAASAIRARDQRKISVQLAHGVLSAISAANVEVSDAIGQSAQAHRSLAAIGRLLGLRIEAFGDEHKPPTGLRDAPAAPIRPEIRAA